MSGTLNQIVFLPIYFENYYINAEQCNKISVLHLLGQNPRSIIEYFFFSKNLGVKNIHVQKISYMIYLSIKAK